MDWTTVFDEAYPRPGATETEIVELETGLARPLSPAEIRLYNSGQRNPFPPGNSLHDSWRPFDAGAWVIPTGPLPPTYLSFLRWSNGGDFGSGNRWFQFFPAADPQHGVRAMLLGYHLPQYMPGALPLGLDGGGVFYLLDMRKPAVNGEYPVVCAASGSLGWRPGDWWPLAESFLAACRGTRSAEDR